ncbi:M16 family metallopeptidase [Sinomicrobium weinanense]|uniref:Insulinase family protein n=1 Tax=Sinomicrobium weinanense TaxID=2842200 RepID=A0A926JQC0_9FLAO|nr:insulinase family protein [Sinomicrobium weinanense]MBC9795374.1 insulinase family protein [Sinomicrobium weinanense]MBU3122911.1 insulinase family protein [Sinomicrobium weinanense]
MNYIIKRTILVALINLLCIPVLFSYPMMSLQDSVPLDPSIRYGHLPNGFTYYIKHIPDSQDVLIDLLVKVGYNNEANNQFEFSHTIEHLAFTTAKHFPVNLRKRLNPLGIRIGGRTGDKGTYYSFSIPSSLMDTDTLDVGLLWFRDIANLELTKDAVNIEKGVVEQEALFKNGDNLEEFSLRTELLARLFPCKPYPYSGHIKHLRDISPQSLIQFYKTWYRPERMGLVIAGDINNMEAIEKRIKERFSDIPIPKSDSPIDTDCQWGYLRSPDRFVALERKQARKSIEDQSVNLFLLYRDKETLTFRNTKKGLYRKLMWSVIKTMIDRRLQEKQLFDTFLVAPKPWFPFYQILVSDDNQMEQQKLQKMIQLIQQIKQYGFNQEEWEHAQAEVLRPQQINAAYWKGQIQSHFVYQEALPENKYKDLRHWLKNLSLKDINTYARQYLLDDTNDIGIIAPTGNKALSYTESEIRGWIKESREIPVAPYVTTTEDKPLLSSEEVSALKKVEYTSKGVNKIGVEEIILNNGVRVILHNYKFSGLDQNKIWISGFSTKGALCFPETDYFSAINAPLIVKTAGVGNMSGKELQNFISKNNFYVNTYINPFETGIKIRGVLDRMESMLQLVYLHCTKPQYPDKKDFEDWKGIEHKYYLHPYKEPRSIDFHEAIAEVLNDKSTVLDIGGAKRFKGAMQADRDRAYNIYRDLYGNASDFTFIISGDFSKETVLPLIQKYLGNLPENTTGTTCITINKEQVSLPKTPLYREFHVNQMKTSYSGMHSGVYYMLRFVSKAKDIKDWKERIKLSFLGRLIGRKLNSFRYEKGAALYNFYGYSNFNKYLKTYNLIIYLNCTEQELEWLRKESKGLIEDIKENRVNLQDFTLGRNDMLRYRTNSEQVKPKDVFMYYRHNELFVDKKEQARFIKSLTSEDIQEIAKKYLKNEYMMEFVMKDGVPQ